MGFMGRKQPAVEVIADGPAAAPADIGGICKSCGAVVQITVNHLTPDVALVLFARCEDCDEYVELTETPTDDHSGD